MSAASSGDREEDWAARTGVAAWSSAPWRELAVSWLDEQLAGADIERTGAVEQPRMRPWATLLTATTSGGRVWLKASAPGTAFEVGLYELLQDVAPERALTPLGIDVGRAWVLLPDGGPSLGERFTGAELVGALATVLPRYGELQRALAPHAGDLLALGVNDMRAAVMPSRFDEALEAMARYVERHGDAADKATHERVAALRANVGAWCDQLATAPVSPSLDHNDLHPRNVFLDDAAGPRFYDWGDSVVAHPFASMLLALGFMRFVEGADDQAVVRLRDAYLEAFSDLAPHAELVETLELACQVGKIARALTWERALRTMEPDDVDEQWAKGRSRRWPRSWTTPTSRPSETRGRAFARLADMDDKVNLAEKLDLLDGYAPGIVGYLNDYKLVVVKAKGEFVWHKHDDTDDFFLVLSGRLTIQLRDRDVELGEGELFVVPRGVEHCPKADEEAHILLIEPKGTVNTGDAGGDLTAREIEI